MKKTVPAWKPVIIVLLFALALALVYPPERNLILGLDLAGGTRLVYQVEIPPEDAPFAERIIDDIIAVQRDRVDPQGVMNLTWRRVGANRIEIQMPLADEHTEQRRAEWIEVRDRIEAQNVDLNVISDFVLGSGARDAAMMRVSGADRETWEAVNQLLEQRDGLLEARSEISEAESRLGELRFELDNIENDADDAQRQELTRAISDLTRRLEAANERAGRFQDAIEEIRDGVDEDRARSFRLLEKLLLTARAYDRWSEISQRVDEVDREYAAVQQRLGNLTPDTEEYRQASEEARQLLRQTIRVQNEARAARRELEGRRQNVQARNLDLETLQRTLQLPARRTTGQPRGAPSLREVELASLRQRFPERGEDVDAAVEAWDAYSRAKRGALDDPADLIRLLRGAGVLEFRIVPAHTEVAALSDYRTRLRESGPTTESEADYVWRQVDSLAQIFPGDPLRTEAQELLEDLENRRPEETLEEYEDRIFEFFSGSGGGSMVVQPYRGRFYVLVSNRPGNRIADTEDGWEVINAMQSTDPNTGFPSVIFRLNTTGARLMGRMSGANIGNSMCIILDGAVMSIATIQSRLGSSVQITRRDGYSQDELRFLIRTLNAGSLAARMGEEPISVTKVAPSAGRENLERGLASAYWAMILVAAFIAVYYLFNGVVTVFVLAFNTLIILAAMSLLQGTFTLPGIAGIVLTIGIAVDANVLIFERIREELERKLDLKSAVKLGYEKALSTIVDANVTTLITCVVLYYTATAEVRGFALTLMIGVLASMFTALFCSRVIFELGMQWGLLKKMPMAPTLIPPLNRLLSPNINWLKARYVLGVVSIVLVLLSITAIAWRGGDIFDIEFRSGTQVAFTLTGDSRLPLDTRDGVDGVRDLLEQYALDNEIDALRSTRVTVIGLGDPVEGKYRSFSILTTIENSTYVEQQITAAFGDQIDRLREISFTNSDVPSHLDAREQVFPIRTAARAGAGQELTLPTLGDVIGDRTLSEQVPPAFIGGVAIVLDNLTPAATLSDIRDRVAQMQSIPPFDQRTTLPFEVMPLTSVELDGADTGGQPLFSRVAILMRDARTNYQAQPEEFRRTDSGALAVQAWELVREALGRERSLDSVTNFSSQVSLDMKIAALQAVFLSLLAVVVYIWIRFGNLKYGLAAILALAHDVIIALGMIAAAAFIYETTIGQLLTLEPFRIDLAMVAAILTLIGYSLNDTIVVFDRIRENRGKLAFETPEIINTSINQTISRTVLTSGTTLLALLTLYIFGGHGSVHGFAFAMIIGILVGTYSSIAIAAPTLMLKLGKKQRAAALETVPAVDIDPRRPSPT
ncbi:MAG: protein translocase subunit SecD [Phycisphaeraceae bacterium]|nr:protein translocase subunit SecD [Phycisphaeraceae bacterium]